MRTFEQQCQGGTAILFKFVKVYVWKSDQDIFLHVAPKCDYDTETTMIHDCGICCEFFFIFVFSI